MRIIFSYLIVTFILLVSVYSCQKIKDPPLSELPTSPDFKNISIDGTVSINIISGAINEVADVSNVSVVLTIMKNTLIVGGYGTLTLKINRCDTVFVNANSIFNASNADLERIVFICNKGSIAANNVIASNSIDVISNNLFINTFSGSTKKLNLSINSTALFSGYSLITKNATVRINNSGDAEVYASDSLSATINGSGDIYYKGNPPTVVPVFISGNGKIIQK